MLHSGFRFQPPAQYFVNPKIGSCELISSPYLSTPEIMHRLSIKVIDCRGSLVFLWWTYHCAIARWSSLPWPLLLTLYHSKEQWLNYTSIKAWSTWLMLKQMCQRKWLPNMATLKLWRYNSRDSQQGRELLWVVCWEDCLLGRYVEACLLTELNVQ